MYKTYEKKNHFYKRIYLFKSLIISINIITIKIIIHLYKYKNNFNNISNSNLYSLNKFNMFNFYNNYTNNFVFYKIINIKYSFSIKFNIAKIIYNLAFYNKNNILINPSDLTLYHNLHIICHININNNKNNIFSLANIHKNKYFKCIELFKIHEHFKFGIKILTNQNENKSYFIYFSNEYIINYNNLIYNNNKEFEFNHKTINQYNKLNVELKKSFLLLPLFSTKYNASIIINTWNFINLYNYYFCLCKGDECPYNNIAKNCKYYFYLSIIDNNKNIYNKTDYLFADFILAKYSSDDTFPIFEKMIKYKYPVHYLTEKIDLYKIFCDNKKECSSIILVNSKNYTIDGNFLEKYLTMFLKLKAAISGAAFHFIDNLFYNIEYITYISIGHGISMFKHYLYYGKNYYGPKRFNKIVLPPSNIIIKIATEHGWSDKNIIKINLPRWDKYNNYYTILEKNNNITNNSIFVMFTWRGIRRKKSISRYYLNNIMKLINNIDLNNALKKKNITLYFTLHHRLNNLIKMFEKSKFIKYIFENEISQCLKKTNLLISDFSSIIFDIICRKKPFIIFVPDANDPNIKNIYTKPYYNIILSLKNNIYNFSNQYFEVNETINKILFYVNNNFQLEKKIKKFYKRFGFKSGNNIKDFIKYLINLK